MGGGGERGALPDVFFFFFPVQQTTSGIGHRVKYCSFLRVGNQCGECEKHARSDFSLSNNNNNSETLITRVIRARICVSTPLHILHSIPVLGSLLAGRPGSSEVTL